MKIEVMLLEGGDSTPGECTAAFHYASYVCGAQNLALEITAFHTVVLAISEILTNTGSELHAKMQVKNTHTDISRHTER